MHSPISLTHLVADSIERDRRRGEERRHDLRRALLDAQDERPSRLASLRAALPHAVPGDDHSLTDYPCRLPDGRIGRVAVVLDHDEWTLVCRAR